MMATMKQILLKEWNHPPLFSSSMVYTTVDGLNVGPTTLDEDYPMNYGVLCVYLSGGYIAVLGLPSTVYDFMATESPGRTSGECNSRKDQTHKN